MANTFTEIRIPFANMSFTPDVPSSALGATEYNTGYNIETDVRSVKSVLGDIPILSTIPGTPIAITSGYRFNDVFWFIVGTLEGRWYAVDSAGYVNITPGVGANPTVQLPGYYIGMPITMSWNGDVLFINDSINPPLFLLPDGIELQVYSNTYLAITGGSTNGTNLTINFDAQSVAPFAPGDIINVAGVNPSTWNNTYTVGSSTTTTVVVPYTGTDTWISGGSVSPASYVWNYNPSWKSLSAGFMRLWATPNVGSILIAGNLTAVDTGSTTYNYPTTVRWSQAFGLNSGPLTWAPTITNVANELEVPVRGPVVDGFPCAGNFYVCSYWDTVIFNPIGYTSTSAPILGVRLLNQGRGLLNENCWANADNTVYGLDARDIWAFDGNNFKPIGDQRVKNYFYSNLNPAYTNQTFMINNTEKYQIEIYYADLTSTGFPNQMISYRYDLDAWNPPRQVTNATSATESPKWTYTGNTWSENPATRTVVYSQGIASTTLVQKDTGTSFLGNVAISSQFRRDNIKFPQVNYSQQVLVHRVFPEVFGTGNITVIVGGADSVAGNITYKDPVSMAITTDNPWIQVNQNAFRTNLIEVGATSNVNTWQMTAASWQYTPTQESR